MHILRGSGYSQHHTRSLRRNAGAEPASEEAARKAPPPKMTKPLPPPAPSNAMAYAAKQKAAPKQTQVAAFYRAARKGIATG